LRLKEQAVVGSDSAKQGLTWKSAYRNMKNHLDYKGHHCIYILDIITVALATNEDSVES